MSIGFWAVDAQGSMLFDVAEIYIAIWRAVIYNRK